jgi:hypothetical protein
MFYTGIGSRETPDEVIRWMKIYGNVLAELGYTLRSGAAPGADAAFEVGCDRGEGNKEIYLPWKNFQKHPSPLYDISEEALQAGADAYGPQFKYLKRPVKLLMSRNCYQVSGLTLDTPSKFVLCWTPDGCSRREERDHRKTGGTGQAIAYASSLGVPIFNLQREGSEDAFLQYLKEKHEVAWKKRDNNEFGQRWSDLLS